MPLARSGLWLLPLLLLQACGNTQLGQQLADSFDPPSRPQAGSPAASVPSRGQDPGPTPKPDGSKPDPVTAPKPTQPAAQPSTQKPPSPAQDPQPYRITIRLSAADPSAPAEVVTRSLREAGIGFEVETIERIQPPGILQVKPEPRGQNP